MATRSISAALGDESRLGPFLSAVANHLPLTPDEEEMFGLHRARNAAIYARWVAMEKVSRGDPMFNERWFQALLALLNRELPRLGITPAAP